MISQSAFEVTLEAVHNIGLRNKRHELLPAVLQESIGHLSIIPQKVLDDLQALQPVSGDIRIFVRIHPDFHKEFEQLKSELSDKLGRRCGIREAVIACCLLIAPRI